MHFLVLSCFSIMAKHLAHLTSNYLKFFHGNTRSSMSSDKCTVPEPAYGHLSSFGCSEIAKIKILHRTIINAQLCMLELMPTEDLFCFLLRMQTNSSCIDLRITPSQNLDILLILLYAQQDISMTITEHSQND